ncbi:transcriptional repressor LexA [Candidatus Bathyarchaeota archaeon]|nr:transcriptional repressor LexA [Candidatus Bathyarchaeota archaeon]
MQGLTSRQQEVLEGIHQIISEKGYPPTVRDIGQRLGLRSSCTVQRHLEALERKGYIKRDRTKARSVEIIHAPDPTMIPVPMVPVPVIGAVAAGQPILAVENIEEVFPLPRDIVKDDQCFMLKVEGDSMIEAGIFDGDYVVVRQQPDAEDGDIVVALLEDEATVKRLRRRRNRIHLEPANKKMKPIVADDVQIVGRVLMSIRRYA